MLPVRAGYTIVEVVVAVGVLIVVLSLALSAASGSRRAVGATVCLAHMRNAGGVVAAYAGDHRGFLPFGGWERREVSVAGSTPVPIGGSAGLASGRWVLVFAGEWEGREWSRSMRCPAQGDRVDEAEAGLPAYWMSSAVWLDAGCLGPERRADAPLVIRPNRYEDVVFPARKVLLFEQIAYCAPVGGAGGEADWVHVIGQTFMVPGSVATMDGAVRRMRQMDGVPAAGSMPFELTVDGVRGVDVP